MRDNDLNSDGLVRQVHLGLLIGDPTEHQQSRSIAWFAAMRSLVRTTAGLLPIRKSSSVSPLGPVFLSFHPSHKDNALAHGVKVANGVLIAAMWSPLHATFLMSAKRSSAGPPMPGAIAGLWRWSSPSPDRPSSHTSSWRASIQSWRPSEQLADFAAVAWLPLIRRRVRFLAVGQPKPLSAAIPTCSRWASTGRPESAGWVAITTVGEVTPPLLRSRAGVIDSAYLKE